MYRRIRYLSRYVDKYVRETYLAVCWGASDTLTSMLLRPLDSILSTPIIDKMGGQGGLIRCIDMVG